MPQGKNYWLWFFFFTKPSKDECEQIISSYESADKRLIDTNDAWYYEVAKDYLAILNYEAEVFEMSLFEENEST